MPIRPNLEEALRQAGCKLDEIRDDDSLFVEINDIVINLELDEEGDRLLLYAQLGSVEDDDIETYKTLLAGNLFWRGGNGATLALDDEVTGGILLIEALAQGQLDGEALFERFANFAGTVTLWRAYLAGEDIDAGSTQAPEAPEGAEQHESDGFIRA